MYTVFSERLAYENNVPWSVLHAINGDGNRRIHTSTMEVLMSSPENLLQFQHDNIHSKIFSYIQLIDTTFAEQLTNIQNVSVFKIPNSNVYFAPDATNRIEVYKTIDLMEVLFSQTDAPVTVYCAWNHLKVEFRGIDPLRSPKPDYGCYFFDWEASRYTQSVPTEQHLINQSNFSVPLKQGL